MLQVSLLDFLAKQSGQNATEASSTVLIDLLIATFSLCIIGIFSFIYISLELYRGITSKRYYIFYFWLIINFVSMYSFYYYN